jgi:hypothetical protein
MKRFFEFSNSLFFSFWFYFCIFFVFFCALCETFAPSAFKKCIRVFRY